MRIHLAAIGILLAATLVGCRTFSARNPDLEAHLPPAHKIPNEEIKTSLPPYVVEPPDVLLIDAIKVVPKVPYLLEPLDLIQIQAENVLPDVPLNGQFQIEGNGSVNLGTQYGIVKVAGLGTEDAAEAIRRKLLEGLVGPLVSVSISQTTGSQQISGEHQVMPQGTFNLGTYGEVYVAGLTLQQTKYAIEKHLEDFLESPEVFVDVFAFNSKTYYIITDGGGLGDRVVRLPIVGGETVLDAISQIGGLNGISTTEIWIARPSLDKSGVEQRLPVSWDEITKKGLTATNYQVFPGDRIFIKASTFTRIDSVVARVTQPIERISGFILLGSGAIRNLNQSFRQNIGNNNNNFN